MMKQTLPARLAQPGWRAALEPLPLLVHLAALACYVLVSLVATWPVVLNLDSKAIGNLFVDRDQNLWNIWWVKTALLDLHTNPLHSDYLFYPNGVDLYLHAMSLPGNLILLLPYLLLGGVAAYNLLALLGLVLSGYAGFRLAYYLTGNQYGALAAGLIIGFNPWSQAMLWGRDERGQHPVVRALYRVLSASLGSRRTA
jgi:hypothetical protein